MKPVASLLPLLLLTAACQRSPQPVVSATADAHVLSPATIKSLSFATVEAKPVRDQLVLPGQITSDGDHTTKVYPLVDGVVMRVTVELGDHVEKGQVLALVRSGEIAETNAQLASAQADVDIARKNLTVAEEMYRSGLQAEREVVTARKELQKEQADLLRVREQLGIYGVDGAGLYPIKAPISGFITEKNVAEGMQYRNEDSGAFFTVADLSTVWLLANVFESDIARVRPGEPVSVTTLAYPGEVFRGTIDKVFNVLDPDSKAEKVRIRLPNPATRLKPAMYAQVTVEDDQPNATPASTAQDNTSAVARPPVGVLPTVPARAVVFDQNQQFVLVYHSPAHIETRAVDVLRTVAGTAYVQHGLRAGERIIDQGNLLVYDELND